MTRQAFLLLISVVCFSYGQNDPAVEKIFKQNTQYFSLDRDAIHLHLNKTTYVTGEEIWFKAYIKNRSTYIRQK